MKQFAVKVTGEWIPIRPEKAMDKPSEMVGEKVNVILRMQNTGSGQIMFAQGAPNAVAALMQELLACSGHVPLALPHKHTCTLIHIHHLN